MHGVSTGLVERCTCQGAMQLYLPNFMYSAQQDFSHYIMLLGGHSITYEYIKVVQLRLFSNLKIN
jgi:hypothetical protein